MSSTPELSAAENPIFRRTTQPCTEEAIDSFASSTGSASSGSTVRLALKIQGTTLPNSIPSIHLVPFELLSLIFVEFCHQAGLGNKSAQLVFTQVCSTWRKVAHGTPRMWTRLGVSIGNAINGHASSCSSSNSSQDGGMIVLWLSRSGELPLRISIKKKGGPKLCFPPDLLSRLACFSHRIQSLHLSVPLHAILPLRLLPSLPLLTTLSLIPSGIDPDDIENLGDVTDEPVSIFAPRLTDLTLAGSTMSGETLPTVISMLSIPVDNLRSVSLVIENSACHLLVDPRPFLNVLTRSSSTLVHCTLRCPPWMSDSHSTVTDLDSLPWPAEIAFPVLQSLTLLDWHDECESRFLRLITSAPSLIRFHTEHNYHGGFGDHDGSSIGVILMSLQSRCLTPLWSLELTSVYSMSGSATEFLSLLSVFPTLRHLKIERCNMDVEAVMQGLQYRGTETRPILVPELESLDLREPVMRPVGADSAVADMVESRYRPGRHEEEMSRPWNLKRILRLVLIFEKEGVDDDVVERLRGFDLEELGYNSRKKKTN